MPHRHKKRRRLYHQDSSLIRLRPTYPNHVWAIDFVHDKLSNGRSYKMLTVLDEYTLEALCVAVRSKITANDVFDAFHPVLMKHGKLQFIRSDNRPEFVALNFQDWLKRVGIQPLPIYPGSPWETGITNASTEPLDEKCLMLNGFTAPNKFSSQSIPSSGNITRSDLITNWG